ncbi:hypothetical protein KEM55_004506 [Ascosphaera atra]|nr:hypothetical protein KEM55_004506 [Ascosphaera atra]
MRFDALNTATAVLAALSSIDSADAFWRLPCRGRSGVARIDPIVDPGKPAGHVHSLHGSGGLNFNSDRDELRAANCTSCAVTQDKSAYWVPSLYFQYKNGSSVIVEQVGGMLAYYDLYGENITAFPKGFRMLAGDQYLRNFSLPVPDPPKSEWKGVETTQHSLMQKALGFNCLNYNAAAEASLYRHTFPEKNWMDQHCTDGLRLEIAFPSCWNGKDLDSSDHRSHVAYPSLVQDGVCPEGFETRIVSLFYETIWNTYAFKGVEGRFVLANGDPTGCGYHADFMEGWDDGVLQEAVDQCTNESGLIEDCKIFNLQDQATQQKCLVDIPDAIKNEDAFFAESGLPGGVPITDGPAPAVIAQQKTQQKEQNSTSTAATATSSSSPNLVSQAAGQAAGAVSQAAQAVSSEVAQAAPILAAESSNSNAPATSSNAAAAPAAAAATSSAPAANAAVAQQGNANAVPVSTMTYTSGAQVFEVAIMEEDVTKTTTVGGAATPAPAKREHVESHKKHARALHH